MLFKTLLPLAGLLSVSSATPTPLESRQLDNYWLGPTVRAPNSTINNAVINAVNGSFMIGKQTTHSYCNVNVAPCDTLTNRTGIVLSNTNNTARMDVYVSNQVAWVADNGQLKYTGPYTPDEFMPTKTQQTGFFRIERFLPQETFAAVAYKGQSWQACSAKDAGSYYVYLAGSKTGCVDFEMNAIEHFPSIDGIRFPEAFSYDAPPVI
ncbi:hypothetical protein BGZ60DRAFT_546963 [Tricladium varicosporioides]|nr:hypothetical protein BGZ60DRAFT_546963 [Hymenoscyphus varicosporioides]